MPPAAAIEDCRFDPVDFWKKLSFWPLPFEQWIDRFWWPILLATTLGFILVGTSVGAPSAHQNGTEGSLLLIGDPFVCTLSAALALSLVAFKLWQRTFRATFAEIAKAGVIPNTRKAIEAFERYSNVFRSRLSSKWRWAPIALFAMFVLLGNLDIEASLLLRTWSWIVATTILIQLLWAYGVGAVAWSLLVAASWLSNLPGHVPIRVQLGHPDRCGGLRQIGPCSFQAVIPLLIGIVLTVVWTYSDNLNWFLSGYSGSLFLSIIVTLSPGIAGVLVVFAGLLALLPLVNLHKHLKSRRMSRERRFLRLLAPAIRDVEKALRSKSESRNELIKAAEEQVRLTKQLDPKMLKMSDWPFDRVLLGKYAAAPVLSVIVSAGKELFKRWL